MFNFFKVIKLTQFILALIIFSACVRSVTPPAPKAAATSTPATPSVINNAPATPTSLSCSTSPLGLSTGNACSLTAASPADPDGDSVSYADGGSTCAGVSVSVLTGDATFTSPAKGATCLVKVRAYDGLTYSSAVSSASISGTNNIPSTPSSLTCAASPLAGSVGNICSLTAASPTDIDSDTITYFDDGSTCAATVINSTTGNATFTSPVKGATCKVFVKAFDGTSYSSAVSSTTITAANNAPNTPGSLTCPASPVADSVGNTCTLTAALTPDPDGDAVTYVNDGSTCPAVVVNATTGGVTFTAPAVGVGCSVRVKAYDSSAYSVALVSNINGTNNAPSTPTTLACVTSPIAGSLNNACTLTAASPADPDGDSVTYSNDGSTCGAVVVNGTTGNVTFTAPAKGANCVVKVRAFDGALYGSAISSATITGANNGPNVPTSIACVTTPVPASLNNACTLTAAGTPDFDGDTVTYFDDGSTCAATVVNSGSGNATFTAPANGATCIIKIKAYDGTLYSNAVSSATITGTNNAPATPTALACATSPLGGSTGNNCTLTAANPADPDGDVVTYSDDGSTCAAVSVSALTGDATFTAPAKGATCLVKVRAFDGVFYGNVVSSATITGSNNAPNIPATLVCETSPPGGSLNNACTLTVASPVDYDGDSVTYVNDGSTCGAVVVNATSGNATFSAPAKGATCLVKIKSFDGTSYSSTKSSETITGANNAPNTPATLACDISPLGGSLNNTCTLTAASPVDLDSDSVTYVNDGSTCGAIAVNATSGNTTFTAPAKGATCLVKIKAFDGTLYSEIISSTTITGINNAPNTPSSLNCTTSPIANSVGNACTVTAASPVDADGDGITYSDDGSTCGAVVVNATTGNATFTAPALGVSCVVKIKSNDGVANSGTVTSATITGSAASTWPFSDNFNRAAWGASWNTWTADYYVAHPVLNGSIATMSVWGVWSGAILNTSIGNNQYAELDTANGHPGVFVRSTLVAGGVVGESSGLTGYELTYGYYGYDEYDDYDYGWVYTIRRWEGGYASWTNLVDASNIAQINGTRMRLEVNGNTLTAKVLIGGSWQVLATVNDNTYSSGKVGVHTTNTWGDNFSAGEL